MTFLTLLKKEKKREKKEKEKKRVRLPIWVGIGGSAPFSLKFRSQVKRYVWSNP